MSKITEEDATHNKIILEFLQDSFIHEFLSIDPAFKNNEICKDLTKWRAVIQILKSKSQSYSMGSQNRTR